MRSLPLPGSAIVVDVEKFHNPSVLLVTVTFFHFDAAASKESVCALVGLAIEASRSFETKSKKGCALISYRESGREVKPPILMESDMALQAAEQHGENPKGQPGSDQIPFGGHVERGKREQDKGKDEQDN
jgi:hypothetical protein